MNPVRRLRTQIGVTQKELAVIAKTSQPTIALYESGKKSPTLETLERLARSNGLEIGVSFVTSLTREDFRSLAYHQAIVGKLMKDQKEVLAHARKNLKAMRANHLRAKKLFDRWQEWLNLPVLDLINHVLDLSLMARDMRQVTPFAGLLSAKDRADTLRRFRMEKKK